MDERDLIVTPLLLVIIFIVAYNVRPFVSDKVTRVHFLPALGLRVMGSLAVGLIYQFYYGGGDTFNFHTNGSRQIWNLFWQDPDTAFRLFFLSVKDHPDLYQYTSSIIFLEDPSSFVIVRLAFLFDLFTFSSYSATAVLFSILSFTGMWMFFQTFYKQFPHLHRRLAIASLYIPSVFFWGSGLLKDTVTLACAGIAVYYVHRLLVQKRFSIFAAFMLLLALFGLYSIKIYILLTLLPAVIIWVFLLNLSNLKGIVLRILLFPFIIITAIVLGYYSIVKAGEGDSRYQIDRLAETARVTAYDIRYYSGRTAGSGYTLGELDGTLSGMMKLAPAALNVTLFRPYLWEVRNPLMLLSAAESFIFLIATIYTLIYARSYFLRALGQPTIAFSYIFSITFAIAVGVSTFNFGTLTRYKIPLLPFFALALILTNDYAKRERNKRVFDFTE